MKQRQNDEGGDRMSEGGLTLKKTISIIVATWILSLVTTLAVVYVSPNIFPNIFPIGIGDGTITTNKIADSAIITTKLADGTVTSAKILDGTLTAVDIADGSIITVNVADGAVATEKIADGAIVTVKLADDSVTSTKILDGTIAAADIMDGAIVTAKMANGAVITGKIADDAIATIKLADGAVTSAKILDGTVTTVDLATGAVTEIKIAAGAVTTNKIADYAVTSTKIADGAVTSTKLTPYTIPFASTQVHFIDSTDSTLAWVDIAYMAVTVTLERTSHLLIMFSVMAYSDNPAEQILIRVKVDEEIVLPEQIRLTPIMHEAGSHTHSMSQELEWPATHHHTIYSSGSHAHVINYMAYSYNFVQPTVGAGTHTIQMQWKVTGGLGYAAERTLAVIALPA